MKGLCSRRRFTRKGFALIAAMIFVVIFSAISVGLFNMSSTSVQVSSNHRKANHALNAAQSGLEYAKYLAAQSGSIDVVLDYQQYKAGNFASQADTIWTNLCDNISATDSGANWVEISGVECDDSGSSFDLRFERDGYTVNAACTGQNDGISRTIRLSFSIGKEDDEILNYGIVGRGRMWVTGDTTIYGDIYSSWENAAVSPFNITEDSTVLGTVNTAISKAAVDSSSWNLETLDSDDNAMFEFADTVYDADGDEVTDSYGTELDGYLADTSGNYVYDAEGNKVPVDYRTRITNYDDELQGSHEGVNYGQNKIGIDDYLDINSYDTSYYTEEMTLATIEPVMTTETVTTTTRQRIDGRWQWVTTTEEVETPVTTREYFPHGDGGYTEPKSGSVTLDRYTYENSTYTDAYLPANQNALFKGCKFEGVLYIDCSTSTSGDYNNVRFEDCEFNGVIVTNTPDSLKWQYNALYFTGSANFNNTSDIQEATILAPHFNVNLGDANNGEIESDENEITGAIVGGIVDIRGNANIFGTVISMCDTSQWTSGYVTNIGATLDDGGSETTSVEDVGTINITPDTNQTLFPGLKEYPCTITLQAIADSYSEGV